MHPPGLLEDLGRGVEERAEGAPATVVDQHARGPELASYPLVRRGHLGGDRRVTLNRQRDAARGPDLVGERTDEIGAPRHQRDAVPLRESAGEGSAQPGADAHHCCDRRLGRYVHRRRPYQGAPVHTTGVTRCCAASERRAMPWTWVPSSAGRSSTRSTTAATATRTPPGRGSAAMRPSPGSSPRACCPSGRSPATRTAAPSCATTGGSSSRPGSGSSPRSRRPATPRRSATCSTWTHPSTAATATC